MTVWSNESAPNFAWSLNIPLWKLFYDSEGCSYGQLVIGNFITTTHPLMHHVTCSFLVKHQITQVTQPPCSPELVPCDFWLFPKLKSPLKGKRFQTIDEIQENTTGQLMTIGRTVWGPKVPTLKGTEVSLSYVQCFLYLLSSSIHVSIFHIIWLDTFWTNLASPDKRQVTILSCNSEKTFLCWKS